MTPGDTPDDPGSTPGPGRMRTMPSALELVTLAVLLAALLAFGVWVVA